ncbi:COX15/CtaA family protein [Lysobacter sp. GX 14042]|uniref:COX15/CtaA family protein n=1 Tax=Lysobacter sp. GX 14042 TaxID=2907155 RepID=UPI001F43EB0F|nr:COX15/CtaA family protein [Lysobacter sp. GX 14042]MCE7033430.1 COX15/CtaA family protein [Lysobacter sp. GX 14042]
MSDFRTQRAPAGPRTASRPWRHFHRLAWLAVALALGVIVFGAFVRLSDAGLSCPDWPTCYGRAAWPTAVEQGDGHAATSIRPVEVHKAWREQAHRMVAGLLGALTLALALLAARRRPRGIAQVVAASALVALAIPLYMRGLHVAASALAIAGELILLAAAVRWGNRDLSRVGALTLAMIILQALLGMWTVTWLLKPVVVMGHLLGGLTTFSLLLWMAWRATNLPIRLAQAAQLQRWVILGVVLLGVQIALGGWTSANYAALSCGTDFPTCVGRWWPPTDFREGFVLWRGIGVDYEGGILDGQARIAIQMAHRIGAVLVASYLLWLALRMLRTPGIRGWASTLGVLVLVQLGLGIANVKLALPLGNAVAHVAGAVLLLAVLVSLLARLRAPEA